MSQTDPPSIPSDPLTEAARAHKRLLFLADASQVLGVSLDYDTTLKQVAQLLVSGMADWCAIDLVEPDGTVREVAVAHADPAKTAWIVELRERYPRDMSMPHGVPNVLRTGKAELYPEVPDELLVFSAQDQTHLELMRRVGFRSAIVAPLIVNGVTTGAISFLIGDSGYRYGEDDLLLAEDIARRAAVAVENARLHAAEQAARQTAQQAAERLARLQRVTAELSEALTVERVAEIVVDQGLAALDADAGSLALLAADGATIEVVRAANYPAQLTQPWKRFPLATNAPLAETVRTGDPLFFEDLRCLQERYPDLGVNWSTPNRAFAAVPLLVDRLLLGSLGLSFRQEREFSAEDREFICAVARQCGQAIQRARLYEAERAARAEAEATRERLTFLSEAATQLTSSLEYGDTLNTVARVAVPSFADFSLLFLLRDDEAIELAEVTHLEPERRAALLQLLSDHPLNPGQPVGAPWVLRTGQSEFVPEFTEDIFAAHGRGPEYQERLRGFGFTSRIVVPLRARGRTFGALGLLQAESGRRFTRDDLALAEELGWRAAVAIDNARLFAEVRDADRRKNEFLAILAHELRNPLAPIRNSLELLQPQSKSGSALEPRAIIERQVSLMVRLVDDLLDVSRITRGKIELRRRPVRLDRILRNAIQTSLPLILERGHVFLTEGLETHLWLDADATRLEQVITNLLNNAAKYTEQGGLIRLSVKESAVEPRMAVIGIADDGIGIEPAMLRRVF
ncbi:MAG: GAF domain-containing protein [Actinomycetota bacterium]